MIIKKFECWKKESTEMLNAKSASNANRSIKNSSSIASANNTYIFPLQYKIIKTKVLKCIEITKRKMNFISSSTYLT